jgi:CRP-like cAMP-binding protein
MRRERVDHAKIEMIRHMPGFAAASDRDLQPLCQLFDVIDVREGSTLAREGTCGREVFLVVDGHATVIQRGETIAEVGPGELIGEMAPLDKQPRCATVRAATSMRVLVAGPGAMITLLRHPILAPRVEATVAARRPTVPVRRPAVIAFSPRAV